jgi:hypothetical protein
LVVFCDLERVGDYVAVGDHDAFLK